MPSTESPDVVVAYRSGDSLDAHAIASQLQDEGIDAHVVGDFLNSLGLAVGGMNIAEVWVPAQSLPASEALIAAWRPEFNSPHLERPQRFHFSMKTALIVMTLAAVVTGAASWGWAYYLFGPFTALLGLAAIVVVVRRWFAARPDDDGDDGAV